MRKRVGKIVFGALCIILLGVIWQAYKSDEEKEKFKPVGEMINVGNYQMHYYSQGQGDTVFCMITGSGTPCAYTDFYMLQESLSQKGQVISFDHAGSGWSERTEVERTIRTLVNELDQLISKVATGKQVVLVCHSLGSLEAIGYAQSYPEKVKGIIFLDSGSPEFYSQDSELGAKLLNRGTAFLRFSGMNRLLGEMGLLLSFYGEEKRNKLLPNETLKEIDKAMYYQLAGNPNTLGSIKLINENAKEILEENRLGDLPILVLSSDSGEDWEKVQEELASSS